MLKGRGMADQAFALSCLLLELSEYLKTWLDTTKAINDPIGQRIKDVWVRAATSHGRLKKELDGFVAGLEEGSFFDEDTWKNIGELDCKCRVLAADFLALEQAIRFDRASLKTRSPHCERAGRLCAAANAMLESFSKKVGDPRSHQVVVSQVEHFGADLSAIHLGCGRLSVWNLNRSIHEFGHLCGEEPNSDLGGVQKAFVAGLMAEGIVEKPTIAKEFFADVMATYLAGPAYGCSCLFLDFNPVDRRPSETHPSHDERAHCILFALECLAERSTGQIGVPMKRLISELEQFWAASRTNAGARVPIAKRGVFETKVALVMMQLEEKIPLAMYGSLATAFSVKINLERGLLKRPGSADEADVLNGAWLRRLEVERVEERALGEAALKMLLRTEG